MLILGEKERDAGNISVRDRTNETHQTTLEAFIADVTAEIAERRG
jgi:threonyl-tRNA synthetase